MTDFFDWPFTAIRSWNSPRKELASLSPGDTGWVISETGLQRQGEDGRRWIIFRLDDEAAAGNSRVGEVPYHFGGSQNGAFIQRLHLPCVTLKDSLGDQRTMSFSAGDEAFVTDTVGSYHLITMAPTTMDGKGRRGYVHRDDVQVGKIPKGRISIEVCVGVDTSRVESLLTSPMRASRLSKVISGLLLSFQVARQGSNALQSLDEVYEPLIQSKTAIEHATAHILRGMSQSVTSVLSRRDFTFHDLWNCPPAIEGSMIYCRLYKRDGKPSGIYIGQTINFRQRQNNHSREIRRLQQVKGYSQNLHYRHAYRASETRVIRICTLSVEFLLNVAEQIFILLLQSYKFFATPQSDRTNEYHLIYFMPARELEDIANRFFGRVSWPGFKKRFNLDGLNSESPMAKDNIGYGSRENIMYYRYKGRDGTTVFRRHPAVICVEKGGQLGFNFYGHTFTTLKPSQLGDDTGPERGDSVYVVFELMPVPKGRHPAGYGRLPAVGAYSDWDECANLGVRVEWEHNGVWRTTYVQATVLRGSYWLCSSILASLRQITWDSLCEGRRAPIPIRLREVIADHLQQRIRIVDVDEACRKAEPRLIPKEELGIKLQTFGLRVADKRDPMDTHTRRLLCDRELCDTRIRSMRAMHRFKCDSLGMPCTFTRTSILFETGYTNDDYTAGKPLPRIMMPLLGPAPDSRVWEIEPLVFEQLPLGDKARDQDGNINDVVTSKSTTLPTRIHTGTKGKTNLSTDPIRNTAKDKTPLPPTLRSITFPIAISSLISTAQPPQDKMTDNGKTFNMVVFAELPSRGDKADQQWKAELLGQQRTVHKELAMIRDPSTVIKNHVRVFDKLINHELAKISSGSQSKVLATNIKDPHTYESGSVYQIHRRDFETEFVIRMSFLKSGSIKEGYIHLRVPRNLESIVIKGGDEVMMRTYAREVRLMRERISSINEPTLELTEAVNEYYVSASRIVRNLHEKLFPQSIQSLRWREIWCPASMFKPGRKYHPSLVLSRKLQSQGKSETVCHVAIPKYRPMWPESMSIFHYLDLVVAEEWRRLRDILAQIETDKLDVFKYAKEYYEVIKAIYEKIGGGASPPSFQA